MAVDALVDDDALVQAVGAGDRDAFAVIYDRYADRLHDFCAGMLHDRDEAADVVQETFVIASQQLGRLREPKKLRAWLFAIARHEALRRARARTRMAPSERAADAVAAAGGPEDRAEQRETVELVRAVEATLAPRDRAVLELGVRQELDGQELADALGVRRDHAYVLLSNARKRFQRALGALLLTRAGRRDCPELARIAAGWDGRLDESLRKRVTRHADRCERCEERRRGLASPLALLGAIPLVPAPASLRGPTLERAAHTAPATGGDGWPSALRTRTGVAGRAAAIGVASAVAAGVVVAAVLWGGNGEDPDRGAGGTVSSVSTTAPSPSSVTPAGFCEAVAPMREAAAPDGASPAAVEQLFRARLAALDEAVAVGAPSSELASDTATLRDAMARLVGLLEDAEFSLEALSPEGQALMADPDLDAVRDRWEDAVEVECG